MLTEEEKRWLERRKNLCTRCEWNLYDNPCIRYGRAGETVTCKGFEPREVGSDDYRDAAVFEARVQKQLMYQYEKVFQCKEVSCGFLPSRETMLMFARLAAEAEMDAQSN